MAETNLAPSAWPQTGLSLRTRFNTHDMGPVAGRRLNLRSFLIQILWPGGGFVWQTPVDLRVAADGGAPHNLNAENDGERFWLLDRTRIALLVIGLFSMLFIWRASRNDV